MQIALEELQEVAISANAKGLSATQPLQRLIQDAEMKRVVVKESDAVHIANTNTHSCG